jgi:hypothetical protein
MMLVTQEMIVEAKQLAQDNYESWGQYIVECYTDEELKADLADYTTIEEWVDFRIRIADTIEERSSNWWTQSSIWGRE